MTNKFTQYPSWDSRTDKGNQLETKIIWKKYKYSTYKYQFINCNKGID